MATASPVVLSQYDPTGQYFAYVSTALDKQRVSVEPTTASKSGLVNDNFLYLEGKDVCCTCIQWITYNDTPLVVLGLNLGEIWLYSPLSNEIVAKLNTGSSLAVLDFQLFSSKDKAWCLTGDDTIFLFDMVSQNVSKKFKIDECKDLKKLCIVDSNRILVASHQIYLIDVISKKLLLQYPGHISPVSFLQVTTDGTAFLSASQDDRFLNIYDLDTTKTKSVLVADSNVISISISEDWSHVSATTEDGDIAIFEEPLVSINSGNKRRSGKISKQKNKTITLLRSNSATRLPIIKSFINKDLINFSWLENATTPYFDQVQLGNLTDSVTTLSKPLPSAKSTQTRNNQNSDISSAKLYKEGNATVTSGDNFKHVESIVQSLDDIEGEGISETLQDRLNIISPPSRKPKERRRANAGTSSVVLAQALKSNDHALLETVLNTRDEKVIQATITRLSPQLATILLERLAERIARQTHRQGALNVWVKWCLIIHGGYLVTIPNLINSLSSLHATLRKRADLLPTLMALDTRITRSLDELNSKRAVQYGKDQLDSELVAPYQDDESNQNEDEEEEVEYIEELDDAGLIDDGEDSAEYSEDDDEHSEADNQELTYTEEGFDDDDEMRVDVEEGYSDEEVQH
ncbi:Utp5p [Kluyveromyces lactis]|uniref:KLLA0C06633p n=1 Tax=Kluyveromyces lactis (strain ATCC 8585 / CBS 2359 / DSM 70799 / NBRC 1267 / NRRL Y-1140 / WM37) TaxID=284590 RepID=Q6CU96_KLULA|nr:uncharacterized protein KLLA0_C06633g [Kluyveromyces lactis]CAH01344.1 KLLA0C06633p [Kluyveromyces lactis]|eukprot:XP_452493.1 uncharacterized protein KLLA0_C06633g [Kluyveromyces lactis]